MAFGALDALRANQLQPRDCWVIGYDDVEMAAWDSFSLTTVRQPSREMARVGANMLIERILSPGRAPRRVNFPCDLIVREARSGPDRQQRNATDLPAAGPQCAPGNVNAMNLTFSGYTRVSLITFGPSIGIHRSNGSTRRGTTCAD